MQKGWRKKCKLLQYSIEALGRLFFAFSRQWLKRFGFLA